MLEQFFSTLGFYWAALLLVWCVATPFLALWLAFSIRKSLKRIADALQYNAPPKVWADAITKTAEQDTFGKAVRRVSNSAFGR